MLEAKFQSMMMKRLREAGAVVFNVHGGPMQAAGWPDLQVYSPIWTGHLELKCGAKPTPLQIRRIEALLRVRFPAFVLYDTGKLWPEGEIEIGAGMSMLQQLRTISRSMSLIPSSGTLSVGKPRLTREPLQDPEQQQNSI